MASVPKHARIIGERPLGAHARLLQLRMANDEPLGFRGGQYIIVHTNLEHEGTRVKRAYSVLSHDREQRTFELAVRRIDGGVGSPFFQTVAVGTVLTFSGPWGKWTADATEPDAPTLVLATDTGITAALGLARSEAFASRQSALLWCATADDYFLPQPAREGARFELVPSVGHPERVAVANIAVARCIEAQPVRAAYLVGDGAVLDAARDLLIARGVATDQIHCEYFFNRPPK